MLQTYSSQGRFNQRLQISLSDDLRKKADNIAKNKDLSLSEVFRFLLYNYKQKQPIQTKSYFDILDSVKGSISAKNHPEWKDAKSINKWLRETRKMSDRKLP